jgi:hypothetical protein
MRTTPLVLCSLLAACGAPLEPGWHDAASDPSLEVLGRLSVMGSGGTRVQVRSEFEGSKGVALGPSVRLAVRWPQERLKTVEWTSGTAELPRPEKAPANGDDCQFTTVGQLFAFIDENQNGELDPGPGGDAVLASTLEAAHAYGKAGLRFGCGSDQQLALVLRPDPLLRATACPEFGEGGPTICGIDVQHGVRVHGAALVSSQQRSEEATISARFVTSRGLAAPRPDDPEWGVRINGREVPGGVVAWRAGLPQSAFVDGANQIELTHRQVTLWRATLVFPLELELEVRREHDGVAVDSRASWAQWVSFSTVTPGVHLAPRGEKGVVGYFPPSTDEAVIQVTAERRSTPFTVQVSVEKRVRR